jgi:hypothetical protein
LRLGQRPAATDDRPHGLALDLDVVDGRDLLGHDQIVASLSVVRIGDGGGADLEVALGLCELFRRGDFLRPHCAQVVLRQQDIEVSLRHPQHEVLAGQRELALRLHHLDLGLVVQRVIL